MKFFKAEDVQPLVDAFNELIDLFPCTNPGGRLDECKTCEAISRVVHFKAVKPVEIGEYEIEGVAHALRMHEIQNDAFDGAEWYHAEIMKKLKGDCVGNLKVEGEK